MDPMITVVHVEHGCDQREPADFPLGPAPHGRVYKEDERGNIEWTLRATVGSIILEFCPYCGSKLPRSLDWQLWRKRSLETAE